MRYIVNESGYVTAITFGAGIVYNSCTCTEYTGIVPSGWNTLDDWYFDEGDKLWRWKIVDGNLEMDPTATAPKEANWGTPSLQYKSVYPSTSTKDVYPDGEYDGLSSVRVYGYSMQSKTVSPSTSKDIDVYPDAAYDGLSMVTVRRALAGKGFCGMFYFSDGKVTIEDDTIYDALSMPNFIYINNTAGTKIAVVYPNGVNSTYVIDSTQRSCECFMYPSEGKLTIEGIPDFNESIPVVSCVWR